MPTLTINIDFELVLFDFVLTYKLKMVKFNIRKEVY